MSRIGNMPVKVPADVEIDIGDDNTVTVKGPKGQLTQRLAPSMSLTRERRHGCRRSDRTTTGSIVRCTG